MWKAEYLIFFIDNFILWRVEEVVKKIVILYLILNNKKELTVGVKVI